MVLCKFFQQGSCRYGTKCNNEHFDVKQILKTDVESAVNGNQWPLSCFGPFKDKPCIPNFIEDQSFEEIRFLCYEARQKNFFEQFHQQFSKEALEAKNKLKSLLQLTPEVVDLVTKMYDAPIDSTGSGAAAAPAQSTNPFGMTVAGAPGTANSIFSKAATATPSAGNIFGGGSSGFNAAANSGAGLFGNNAGSAAAVGAGGGIFSASANQTFNSVNAQQTPSMFAQAPKTTNSIFGGGVAQPTPFGQMATQNTATTSGGGLFSQAVNTQQTVGGGLFAQAAQQQPSMGIFSQAAQQSAATFTQQQQQQQVFAQQQQQQNAGLFAQTSQQQAASNNPFGQQQQQQPQMQASGGLFATAAAQSQNMFSQQPTNMFTQVAQPPPPATAAASSFFQQQNSTFMQQQQPTPAAAAPTPAALTNSSVYSRLEDLTAEEIEAFKADHFTLGKIPFSPPPRELIN